MEPNVILTQDSVLMLLWKVYEDKNSYLFYRFLKVNP